MSIGAVTRALSDFAKQLKSKSLGGAIQRQKGNLRKLKKLGIRGNKDNFPLVAVNGFEDAEFYGFCSDFERRKGSSGRIKGEIGSDKYAISTLCGNTDEWKEEKLKLGGRKKN